MVTNVSTSHKVQLTSAALQGKARVLCPGGEWFNTTWESRASCK
jgi:hypothetical protein